MEKEAGRKGANLQDSKQTRITLRVHSREQLRVTARGVKVLSGSVPVNGSSLGPKYLATLNAGNVVNMVIHNVFASNKVFTWIRMKHFQTSAWDACLNISKRNHA